MDAALRIEAQSAAAASSTQKAQKSVAQSARALDKVSRRLAAAERKASEQGAGGVAEAAVEAVDAARVALPAAGPPAFVGDCAPDGLGQPAAMVEAVFRAPDEHWAGAGG
eukprot:15037285-Alexandrium_andersonii.AAC.1